MATAFAGMASAQLLCTAATANAVFVRAESNDDQVADTTLTCSVPATNTAIASGTVNLTVYLSPSVNISSFNVGTSSTPKSEAIAGLTAGFVAGGGAPFVSGSVSGNSVTFSGIAVGALAAGSAPFTLTITNIKIAASTVATGSGVPTGVSETIFVSGTNTTPSAITTGSAVAYVTNGLSNVKANNATGNALCNSTTAFGSGGSTLITGVVGGTAAGPTYPYNFNVQFSEAFPNAFKIGGTAAANNALGLWYTNHTETGTGVTSYSNANTATSGTRIKIIFNNIPANVTVYVPATLGGPVGTAGPPVVNATTPFPEAGSNGAMVLTVDVIRNGRL